MRLITAFLAGAITLMWLAYAGRADPPASQPNADQPLLEFRIAYVPGQGTAEDAAEAKVMIDRLVAKGPAGQRGDRFGWFDASDPQELKYPTLRSQGGKQWLLCYVTPAESMVLTDKDRQWALRRVYREVNQRTGQAAIGFEFDDAGSKLFGELSGNHIGRPLAIILEGKVISAPNLQSRIEGRGIITGKWTAAELDRLIRILSLAVKKP